MTRPVSASGIVKAERSRMWARPGSGRPAVARPPGGFRLGRVIICSSRPREQGCGQAVPTYAADNRRVRGDCPRRLCQEGIGRRTFDEPCPRVGQWVSFWDGGKLDICDCDIESEDEAFSF